MRYDGDSTDAAVSGRSGASGGADLAPGDTLAGRFVLRRKLGCGASGVVWSALDIRVGDRVAVKILDASMRDPANRERLRREIRSSRSGHPNLVSIHELHESHDRFFLTMELVDGPSLRDVLSTRGSLAVEDVVRIGRQIADALAHLHGQGVVHRDVKPGNIVIDPSGVAKLCDMGLARPVAPGATITESRMVVGTPTYMAPEMARGAERVAASDIYALGLTLFQGLTGKVPLAKTTAVDTLMARQEGRAVRLRKVRRDAPSWLDRLLASMLDPDPRVRPAAAQVSRALDEQRFTWRPGRRHLRAAAVVLGSVAAAAVLVAVASSWIAGRGDPARDDIANTLLVTAESTDNGTVYTILDGYRRRLRTMTSGTELNDKNANFFRNKHVAFADLNGDRRTDVVFAISDPSVEHQIEIYQRRPDGGLELVDAWNLHLEMDYDGRTFGTFMPRDVVCGDLDGDGRPEIVVVQISSPFYPGTVRVFDATGHELLRVLHPGLPANALIGDRDRDGRSELYVGATNNFVADTPGRESLPVFFAVDVDWERSGHIVSLFGPGRRLPDRVPKGVRLIYALFDRQRLVEPSSPWRFASVRRISPESADQFLEVIANRVEVAGAQKVMALRSFYLDRRLRMTDALWVSATLDRLGLNIGAEDLPDQLGMNYWNGSTWQPEVCPVPQSE